VKVIFLEDVTNVARAGDTKEVADGFGRNYLLPKKLAVLANSAASSIVEAQLKKLAKQRAATEAEMTRQAASLNGKQVTLTGKVGAQERLYGSITSADIAEELGKTAGVVVDRRKIELAEPIHSLGNYDVTVRFTADITAVLKVTVVGENGEVATLQAVEEAKAEAKEEPKAEVKAEAPAKAEKKPKAKAAKKTEGEADAKPEVKAEKKPKAKKSEKVEADAEAKSETKPEVESEVKEEKKPKAKAEKKPKKKAEDKTEG
jgi:large subunit ribosomal protein L9